jgi:hypothetical protein
MRRSCRAYAPLIERTHRAHRLQFRIAMARANSTSRSNRTRVSWGEPGPKPARKRGVSSQPAGISNRPLGEERARQAKLPPRGAGTPSIEPKKRRKTA